ncbi:fasciclin domain-containing protein, partial [Cryomorphaceae bacterium 1068]|nr:fasciclin domain-containing protein [Cryomorphaceae bacterium 1068]
INQAVVELADVGADNGIVHAIDAVLLSSETVVDVAIDNGFTSLTAAVVTAELLPALTDPFADFTVFAPSNEAFVELANELGTNAQGILTNPELANILLYHVLDGAVMSSMINNGDIVTPLNDANTLKLTATSGGDVFVNQAQVELADVGADNGVVHAIDGVLLSSETVVDIAIDNSFTTLTTAVVTAELLPALTDPFANHTVFAPTDEAFDMLAAELETDLDGLLGLPNLADILLYHVVGEDLLSTELTEGGLLMLNGQNTVIDLSDGVQINNATVIGPDNGADNGIVHIINAVLDQNFVNCETDFFLAPQNLEVVQSQFSEDITFQWDPVPGSVICQLRLQTFITETAENIFVEADEDGSEPSQITLSQSDFDGNDIYQVKVRCACSIDPLVASDFSQIVLFVPFGDNVISSEQGIQTANGINTMTVFPNPSNLGYINLRISNSENTASEGLLEIRDITGRSVASRRVVVEANQLLQVETNNMPAGMYTVSYTSGSERVTERFVVE